MTTQAKLQYTPPMCEELDIQLEGVIALSETGVENPDIENTDI